MSRTLFERLKTGETGGRIGRSPRRHDTSEGSGQVLASILCNLQRLLNSRQGHAQACPEYGLLDMSQVLSSLPDGAERIEHAIQKCIEQYEPRLTRVRVKRVEDPSRPLHICFWISARLLTGNEALDVSLETLVATTGRVQISRR